MIKVTQVIHVKHIILYVLVQLVVSFVWISFYKINVYVLLLSNTRNSCIASNKTKASNSCNSDAFNVSNASNTGNASNSSNASSASITSEANNARNTSFPNNASNASKCK